MSVAKKATVYFEPALHKAIRVKAAEIDQSISDLVNEALRSYLLEDAEDLAVIASRKNEPRMDFETLVKNLKRDGKI